MHLIFLDKLIKKKYYKPLLLCMIMLSIQGLAQTHSIRGSITSSKAGLPFVNVYLQKTTYGCITDVYGNYSLNNIPSGNYTLVISCIGFNSIEKKIDLNSSMQINFELDPTATSLNEFVITGVSKATRIKENPLAISRIDIKQIAQSNESNLMDVLQKNSTGVAMLKTGPNISKPFIRGLGYNRVLTLYDGIRQEGQQWGDEHGIEIDAYESQNIEVIKGPASLMYGSDAVAGVISFIPQTTDTSQKGISGKVINEYHQNNNLTGNGVYVNHAHKNLIYNFGASHRLAKNYRNKVDGRVYNTGFQEINLAGKLSLKLKHSDLFLKSTLYQNIQGIPDGSRDSLSRKFTYQVFEGDLDNIKNRPIVSQESLNSYAPADLHQQIKHYRLYAKQNFNIGRSNLSYILAWQHNIRKEITHPTNLNQAGLFVKLNTINYSLLYHFSSRQHSTTSFGINGMWQHNKNDNGTDFPIPNYQLFDAGAFLHQFWNLNKFNFSAGIRYDFRKVNVGNLFTTIHPNNGFVMQTTAYGNPETYHQYEAFTKIFDGLSGSAGLSYIMNKHWHLKANLSRGYRAPSITELASNGLDPGARITYLGNKKFVAEFSNQQDIGLFLERNNFDFSVTLFHNYIQNYIYLAQLADENNEAITDAQGNKTFQYQQAKAQLHGFESSFIFHPEKLKGFSVSQHFQFVKGYNRSKAYSGKGIDGGYLPFIPPAQWQMQISETLKLKKSKLKILSPRVECEYHAEQNRYMALYGTETFTPSYFLIHAALQFEFKINAPKQLLLQLFINNISDKIYQSNMSRLKYFEYFTDTRANSNGIYNMGRNLGAKLIYHF